MNCVTFGWKLVSNQPTKALVLKYANVKYLSTTKVDIKDAVNLYYEKEQHQHIKKVIAPMKYVTETPWICFIPKFIAAFQYWLNLSQENMRIMNHVSLISFGILGGVNDIIDGSKLRRSYPTPHEIYGNDRAHLSFTQSLLSCIQILKDNPKAVDAFCKNMSFWLGAMSSEERLIKCPSLQEYFMHCIGRTGMFYKKLVDIMLSYSEYKEDLNILLGLYGIYVQILNDIQNCSIEQYINGKIFAEDISNGAFSLPIVLAATTKTYESDMILSIVKKKTESAALVKLCVEMLIKLDIFEEAKKLEELVRGMVFEEIERLGGNPTLIEFLNDLSLCKTDEVYVGHPQYDAYLQKIGYKFSFERNLLDAKRI